MEPARSSFIREWTFIEPTELANDKNRRLHAYWRERHAGDALPARGDLDPIEMDFILGNVVMVDVLRDAQGVPESFRYRLAGTHVTRDLGFDPTGWLLDAHPDPTYRDFARSIYLEVVGARAALAFRIDAMVDDRLRRYEAVVLPLAADGVSVDIIMSGQCPLA